jgi:hypothetical protein
MSNDMKKDDTYSSKKCPECLTYIPVKAEVCPSCKRRVGKITDTGMARKAFDWKAYLGFVLALAAFVFYIWWAFFRK